MKFLIVSVAGLAMLQGQTPSEAPLTDETLRAWMTATGTLASNRKLIHEQFAQQRTQFPPWWPDSVANEEEQALLDVDVVHTALPFYSACFSEHEGRVLVKVAGTQAGHQAMVSGIQAHDQSARSGRSPQQAQQAKEDAIAQATSRISDQAKEQAMVSLTPEDRRYAETHFNAHYIADKKACTDKAFVANLSETQKLQKAALQAVIENRHDELVAARSAWEKDHPQP